jgi:hypothetical protein
MKHYSESIIVLTKFTLADFYYDFNDNLSGLVRPLDEITEPERFVHVPADLILAASRVKSSSNGVYNPNIRYRKLTPEQEKEMKLIWEKEECKGFFKCSAAFVYKEKIEGSYDGAISALIDRHLSTKVTIGAKDSVRVFSVYVHESPEDIMNLRQRLLEGK